jgi:FkbH-like protein
MARLSWLPKNAQWDQSLKLAESATDNLSVWRGLVQHANFDIDFVQTGKLDKLALRLHNSKSLTSAPESTTRVALLGSSTIAHLPPGIRVAGLRRGIWIDLYLGDYGQYLQELMDADSALHRFAPEFVCFAFDAQHLLDVSGNQVEAAIDHVRRCWQVARNAWQSTVIQQTPLPVFADLMGNNEHRLPDSPQRFIKRFNALLETALDEEGGHLLDIEKYAAIDGIQYWHSSTLWHRSKQEVHPAVSHLYGEYLARLVAAQRGRSAKCLVLDLDNTLWGGVIGDDGLQGIVLGQGNTVGEAFIAFQRYVRRLKERGIILAVCSKNDELNAKSAFTDHPEMVLKLSDIACFVANWDDKATNLRRIASSLNIGIDSLVFVDDNAFERNLVRQQLPEVIVPEMPDDPALYVECLAAAGYFEALSLTSEDRERAEKYQANAQREQLRSAVPDLTGYLEGLNMELRWKPFDKIGLQRIVQLINKTNQFNLTTQRYGEAEVQSMMGDPRILTWQLRLTDRFGDNGIIALLIGRIQTNETLKIDTWLMSCRVLGRQVEDASLNLIADCAKRIGIREITGEYRQTAKNGMVRDLYTRLGFAATVGSNSEMADSSSPNSRWTLGLSDFVPRSTAIRITEDSHAGS